MQKVSRQFFIELLWLAISLALTILLGLFFFGQTFLGDKLDIHFRDTYFVIAPRQIWLPVFFMMICIVYFIKEFRNSFRRTIPNGILITVCLALIITLTFLIRDFSHSVTGGWTLYPPLSALEPGKAPELTHYPVTRLVTNFLIAIQIGISIMLLFVYHWGKKK